MNKKEIAEIRKAVTAKEGTIETIGTCFVSVGKGTVFQNEKRFGPIPEEEKEKYLRIFRKGLSGRMQKTLFHMEIEEDKEQWLLQMREDPCELLGAITENYQTDTDYLVVIARGSYDIPKKQGADSYGEGGESYQYMLFCLCPVSPTKPALSVDVKGKEVSGLTVSLIAGAPVDTFLYPSFAGRCEDVHHILYHAKKMDDSKQGLLKVITGKERRPDTEEEVMDWMSESVTSASGGRPADFGTVKVFEHIAGTAYAEGKQQPDEPHVGKPELSAMLEKAGFSKEMADDFLNLYESRFGRQDIPLSAVTNGKNVVLDTGNAKVKADLEIFSDINVIQHDGNSYLAIPLDGSDIAINGITGRTNIK